jgi:hypothetical protein
MNSITINQFTNELQNLVEQVINQDGADFVVISAEDWDNKNP